MRLVSQTNSAKIIKSSRHQKVLDYALNQIQSSALIPYINAIYLYGSCARGQEQWTSDIDLFLEFNNEIKNHPELKYALRSLKSVITTDNIYDPESNLKIVIGPDWKNSKLPFYCNIRKEGILIWP